MWLPNIKSGVSKGVVFSDGIKTGAGFRQSTDRDFLMFHVAIKNETHLVQHMRMISGSKSICIALVCARPRPHWLWLIGLLKMWNTRSALSRILQCFFSRMLVCFVRVLHCLGVLEILPNYLTVWFRLSGKVGKICPERIFGKKWSKFQEVNYENDWPVVSLIYFLKFCYLLLANGIHVCARAHACTATRRHAFGPTCQSDESPGFVFDESREPAETLF